jgi:Gpi18-like mannosyltransferase
LLWKELPINWIIAQPKQAVAAIKSRTSPELWFIVKLFGVSRALYYAVVFIVLYVKDLGFKPRILCQYDCGWYKSITAHGYMTTALTEGQVGAANWAFFPLHPLIVKAVADLTQIPLLGIAYLLGNVFLLGALVYLYKYISQSFSATAARYTIILMAFSPVNVYFTSFYTESLFLFLSSATIYYVTQRRWILAGVLGSLLGATRSTGFLIGLIFIAVFVFNRDWKREDAQLRNFLFSLSLLPLGLFSYMIFLHYRTGDFLAFYHTQKAGWGWTQNKSPLWIVDSLRWLVGSQLFGSTTTKVLHMVLIVSCFACLYFLLKKRYIELIMLLPITLFSLNYNYFVYRYFLGLYPIYLMFALLGEKKKWVFRTLLACEVAIMPLAVYLWVTGFGPT